MAVVTISRQFGSGGDEIAALVCEALGYHYFDKNLMIRIATEASLSPTEVVDFSEDNYKTLTFLDRLFSWTGPRTVAHVGSWGEANSGARTKIARDLDEAQTIAFVQSTILAAYKKGNMVIIGRGSQVVLKGKPDVLHVRIEAPLDTRNIRISQQFNASLGGAQDIAIEHDRTAADYLKRFYNIDWADSAHYDVVINTGKLDFKTATDLIITSVKALTPTVQVNSN
jgi:cytidylate kinase